jgi:hypothetical protein
MPYTCFQRISLSSTIWGLSLRLTPWRLLWLCQLLLLLLQLQTVGVVLQQASSLGVLAKTLLST